MLEKNVVSLNDFRQERIRMESTYLCRSTLDRTIYMYNNEVFPELVLLKLLRNAAGLLEKKLKLNEMSKCTHLPDDKLKKLNSYENEISQLVEEVNKILDKLAECRTNCE